MTVVWINGAPGSGKTSVADVLALRHGLGVLDPEVIGQRLQSQHKVQDYQALSQWRVETAGAILEMHSRRSVVVPMSIATIEVRADIFGYLRAARAPVVEVFLDAPESELRRRVISRGGPYVHWCLQNIGRLRVLPDGVPVLSTQRASVSDVADAVAQRVRLVALVETDGQTVLVDMDGVLADFDSAVIERLRRDVPNFAPRKRVVHKISDTYVEYSELVSALCHEPNFFSSLPEVEGAVAGWSRLLRAGYRPRVCTSPLITNVRCADEKREWIAAHLAPVFGEEVVAEAIIVSNKSDARGRTLIDDNPRIKHAALASWEHVIFDRPYNAGVSNRRLLGWHDPALESLMAGAGATPPR